MRSLGIGSYQDYAAQLDLLPEEYERLKDRITVNVTEFFRDEDVYAELSRELLPPLVKPPVFRAWSAGCSSGEEAYSLAMLLARIKSGSPELSATAVSILATDIDEACLARARAAVYPAEAAAKAAAWKVEGCLEQGPEEGTVRVRDSVKSMVSVQRHNLFADPPPCGFDLVLCRNVMIYFSRDLQQRLLEAFHKALAPGGLFLLGKTETILGPARQLFTSVSARTRAFRRA